MANFESLSPLVLPAPEKEKDEEKPTAYSKLFTEYKLRGVTLRNRIGLPPMVTWSCGNRDGKVDDWHIQHYASRAVGGFGLMILEATGVLPEGRISPYCLGLWSDEHIPGMARIAASIKRYGATPCVQLAHAGRKGSTYPAWHNRGLYCPPEDGGWEVVGPTTEAYGQGGVPRALTTEEVAAVPAAFAAAARRAIAAGFEVLEVHAAHGYLLNQFMSPLINKPGEREDEYGGASFDTRTRLTREVIAAIRAAIPEDTPLLVRLSCVDYQEGGWAIGDTVALAKILKELGVDMIDCSAGGAVTGTKYNPFTGYMVAFADEVRKEAGIPTAAVGLITTAAQAESVVANDRSDLVLVGRQALRDAYFPMHAAAELGSKIPYVQQYRWCLDR